MQSPSKTRTRVTARPPRYRYRFICPPTVVSPTFLKGFGHRPYMMIGSECFVRLSPDFLNVQDALVRLFSTGLAGVFPALPLVSDCFTNLRRYFLMHHRAHSDEAFEYHGKRVWGGCAASTDHVTEDGKYTGMCVSLYREDIEGGERIVDPANYAPPPVRRYDSYLIKKADEGQHSRLVERTFRNMTYVGAKRPQQLTLVSEVYNPYDMAVFMEVNVER